MIRPILFNTEMVRAILDGRKTVTRRMVKPKQLSGVGCMSCPNNLPEEFLRIRESMFTPFCNMPDNELIGTIYKPPYQPGDILYVRETWSKGSLDYNKEQYYYRADNNKFCCRWHPAIHMPKEAARIWLKVTDVRVERLQDITEEQAKAEGAVQCYEELSPSENQPVIYIASDGKGYYVLGFKSIWNPTIKEKDLTHYGWDANPWVWVIEFLRCKKPI